jgi:hypothetical protein
MKFVLFYFCVFYIITPLLAETNFNYLSVDGIMQGLKSRSNTDTYPKIIDRQKWLNSLYPKRAMLTNDVERIKLTKELVRILNSATSSSEDKCAAAYLIGLFQIQEGINALIKSFLLGNKAALEPDLITAEGAWPAQKALIRIGEPAIPAVIEFIESATNTLQLNRASGVILYIKGQKEGAEFLKQAITEQTDSKKKENLKAALASEYFTDPKYQASGPAKKFNSVQE